jgi:NADPH-dependent curcumin reductase CurA
VLVQRALVQGFIVLDHFGRLAETAAELAGWISAGKLEPLETAVEGFEELPRAVNMLFDGANIGKLVVRLSDD